MTMFSNVLNSLIKITWRQKTNNKTKEKKQQQQQQHNNNNNNNNKKERMYTCIVMRFRHSHIEISFTPKMIYEVIHFIWNIICLNLIEIKDI